ncbi:hypothetical protein [Bacillus ndiopicus]|uniref:hypothetical protein n=1 Tax=Bacillus ndiopicus TaxID=1347368 RepID=UPI0005A65D19|nr:hypothetical protein [Bacillus ndiopicus]
MKKGHYIRYIVWMIGLLFLLFIFQHFQSVFEQKARESFDPMKLYSFQIFMYFIIGCYLAIIVIQSWRPQLNLALFLAITIPCTIIALYFPMTLTIPNIPMPKNLNFFIMKREFFPLIAGFTFLLSLFSASKKGANKIL